MIDLSVRRDAPNQALALVWDAQRIGYSSRILASDDNGRSFLPYGTADRSGRIGDDTRHCAEQSPPRLRVRHTFGRRSTLSLAVRDGRRRSKLATNTPCRSSRSSNRAFTSRQSIREDADTLYLRTSSATVSRLLVSHDGGQQFSVAYSGSLLAFSLSPDGKQLYFGGEDGLYAGLASDLQFEKRASLRVLCLATSADSIYACSDEHSGFTVGASRDGGSTFEPLLHLEDGARAARLQRQRMRRRLAPRASTTRDPAAE